MEVFFRSGPVGLDPPAPLGSLVLRALKEGKRLPAGFFLGFLGSALVLLELLVDLFLGLGVFVLDRLSRALKCLDDLVARLAYSASRDSLSTLNLPAS